MKSPLSSRSSSYISERYIRREGLIVAVPLSIKIRMVILFTIPRYPFGGGDDPVMIDGTS